MIPKHLRAVDLPEGDFCLGFGGSTTYSFNWEMGFFSRMWRQIPFLHRLLSLPYPRKSPRPDPSTLLSVPEKEAPNVPGNVVSDEARSVGGAERSVKRYQPSENQEALLWQTHWVFCRGEIC